MSPPPVTAHIEAVINDLIAHGDFPHKYRVLLETRLPIVCRDIDPARLTRPTRRESDHNHKQKRSQIAYREVLQRDPLLFLPFLLAVAPSTARKVDVTDLQNRFCRQNLIRLSPKAEEFIIEIAERADLLENRFIKNIRHIYFPSVSFQSIPTTPAEGNDINLNYLFKAPNWSTVCDVFGSDRSHALHISCPSDVGAQPLEGVRLKVPSRQSRDAVLFLDVENAVDLARILFPQIRHVAFPSPSVGWANTNPLTARELGMASNYQPPPSCQQPALDDRGYFTLSGGTVAAICSVFGPSVNQGIAECEARAWEKDHFLLDTTDCVTMTVSRAKPQYGTVRLRISYTYGATVANIMSK